jgi:hypothetical protein
MRRASVIRGAVTTSFGEVITECVSAVCSRRSPGNGDNDAREQVVAAIAIVAMLIIGLASPYPRPLQIA